MMTKKTIKSVQVAVQLTPREEEKREDYKPTVVTNVIEDLGMRGEKRLL
jgi:hypothetical protein